MLFVRMFSSLTIAFFFADPAIVRLSQQLLVNDANETPVYFSAHVLMSNFIETAFSCLWFFVFLFLCKFKITKDLMLKYPRIFSFGIFSHQGPTKQQMKETSFSSVFLAQGYAKDNQSGINLDAKHSIWARVKGPEPGYVTTPICVVNAALTILANKKKASILPTGVVTPSVAFRKTDLVKGFHRMELFLKL
jgi:hypothetical protein